MVAAPRRLVNPIAGGPFRLVSRPPRRAAARPGGLNGRVVDPQAAALQVGAVELLLGALGVLGARHGDEREAARLTRVAVGDDRYRLAGARLREQLAQLVLRDPVGEVADEELLGHLGPLLISASQRLQCGRRCTMTPRPWRCRSSSTRTMRRRSWPRRH